MKTQSKSIVVSSNQSSFKKDFYPPIVFDSNGTHEMALIGLDMYNSIPNIDERNNLFMYSFGEKIYTILIPTGSYEIETINKFIAKKLTENEHDDMFEIRANLNTLKCIIEIKNPNIKIHFNHAKSLKKLFGFSDDVLLGIGEHESTNIVNILSINAIMVHCSVIGDSYLNSSQSPIIYTFFPNVPPGYKIVEKPRSVVFLPITVPTLDHIRIWLTDQDQNLINQRGETVTIRLQIKSTF